VQFNLKQFKITTVFEFAGNRNLPINSNPLPPVQKIPFSMASSKFISFAEIVKGRDASVRVTDDRLLYAVDLAMLGTGKGRDYAGQVIILV
jgi:hypothetical protein